jgi:hypothetical protein
MAACSGTRPLPTTSPPFPAATPPRTRAERTGYRETSRYDDVLAFLDSLVALGAPVRVDTMGRSAAGRAIPYAIASRPLVRTVVEARHLGRPVVFVQGNIHGGEVEGKEALLALLRDLTLARVPNALDSVVLVAVPIYNVDGNEREGPQERNRGEQNGPAIVGERANGQGLDLNRDYIKAEAPETRAALAIFNAWDPHVFVDLHTTNGSYHGYALTYAPSLSPAARFGGSYARDSLLPELQRRMRDRRGLAVFDYGNFSASYADEGLTDTVKRGWYTYDHRPRFGANYYGLRGRVAILSEAYSHEPFERRIASTYAFVAEILTLTAERGTRLIALARAADSTALAAVPVALRSELTRAPDTLPVIVEQLVARADTNAPGEAGVPRGVRRTGRYRTQRMPVYTRFAPTLSRPLPFAWSLGAEAGEVVRRLRGHGVRVEQLAEAAAIPVEVFAVDSIAVAPRPFQGHHEVTLGGRWRREQRVLPSGAYVIPAGQPLGIVAMVLLEPESDDGLVTWNVFDAAMRSGADFPVVRIPLPFAAARRLVD